MNGAEKSAVAKSLANSLGLRLLDIEDYCFFPADPLFSVQRTKEEVSRMLRRGALSGSFVFASVSPDGYGIDDLISAVFRLEAPFENKIPRIRERRLRLYGDRVLPGGDMHDNCEAFVKICKACDQKERKSRAKLPGVPFIEFGGGRKYPKM